MSRIAKSWTASFRRRAIELLKWNGNPISSRYGGSSPTGALGYAFAVKELNGAKRHCQGIVFATSSGETQAGLMSGQRAFGYRGKVLGISIDESEAWLEVYFSESLASAASEKLGKRIQFTQAEVLANADYCKVGYGVPNLSTGGSDRSVREARRFLAGSSLHGTRRCGQINLIRNGFFKKYETAAVPAHFGATRVVRERPQRSAAIISALILSDAAAQRRWLYLSMGPASRIVPSGW